MTNHRFELFADYFQVYLMDEAAKDDTSEIWTKKAFDLRLAIAKNTIAIGTYRNVDVILEVEVLAQEPEVKLSEWDHATQGYITIPSGKCAVFGCSDCLPDAARIPVPPGDYQVLSLAKGLDSITTEWEEAEDFYKVIMWPSYTKQFKSLKRYEHT